MNRMIQPLENRVLLSATLATLTADSAAVTSAIAQTKAAVASLHAAEVSLHSSVVADVKATETKSQKSANLKLNAALTRADNTAAAKITAAESALFAIAKAGSAASVSLGKQLIAHPTKTSIQTAVTKEITKLDTAIAAKELTLSTVTTNTLAAINAVYSDVVIEDPTAASDVTTGQAGVATAESAYTTTAGTVATAVTQLTTDLATA
jgi:hypothetical protein